MIALYRGFADLARVAAAFVGAGLAAGDRVVYLAGDRPLTEVQASLEAINTSAGPAIEVGQLMLRSFTEVYGEAGHLNLAEAANGFRVMASLAKAEGFPGLRIAAEMGDFCRALGSIEQVLAWERMATQSQQETGITSVCHYDQLRLDRWQAELIVAEHAGAAPQTASEPLASILATPRGLRISGEVDITNRHEVLRAVRARLAACHHLTIDAGELTFIDAGTFADLYRIAGELPPDRRVIVANASVQLQRLVTILGWKHRQLRIEPSTDMTT